MYLHLLWGLWKQLYNFSDILRYLAYPYLTVLVQWTKYLAWKQWLTSVLNNCTVEHLVAFYSFVYSFIHSFIHSLRDLSCGRSVVFSKARSPQIQIPVSPLSVRSYSRCLRFLPRLPRLSIFPLQGRSNTRHDKSSKPSFVLFFVGCFLSSCNLCSLILLHFSHDRCHSILLIQIIPKLILIYLRKR
jgi:hypothetical protein